MTDESTACPAVAEGAGAAASAILWGALAQGLLRPDSRLASELRSGDYVARIASAVDPGASEDLDQAVGLIREFSEGVAGLAPEELRLRLEVEYNRLFVGPLKVIAPPYESYYASADAEGEGGRLRTQDEFAVKVDYALAGYRMPQEFVDLPDHVAIELDFLALLARDESAAWEAGEREKALGLQRAADEFASEHPCRWLGQLAGRVDEGAKLAFYPAVLRIARTMLGV